MSEPADEGVSCRADLLGTPTCGKWTSEGASDVALQISEPPGEPQDE